MNHFKISITKTEETGLAICSVEDTRTGYIVRTALPNHLKQTASIMAFAGARYSRSNLGAINLFKEINSSSKDANEKLTNIFKNYGHASVGDMANLFAYIENVPSILITKIFYESSVGSGQEVSTRYVDFNTIEKDNLKQHLQSEGVDIDQETIEKLALQWDEIQDQSKINYNKYVQKLTDAYINVYDIDTTIAKNNGALTARVFDTARAFLPSGMWNKTSMAYITSAREWARIISILKGENNKLLNFLAEQLEFLFSPDAEIAKEINYIPEASGLIRHTLPDTNTNNNLTELKQYLSAKFDFENILVYNNNFNNFIPTNASLFDLKINASSKMLYQLILTLHPNINSEWLEQFISKLDDDSKKDISTIIFKDYSHHAQCPNQFEIYPYSYQLDMSISEARDFNRHRAWGRFSPLLTNLNDKTSIEGLFNAGYTLPLYLTNNSKLENIRGEFEKDLKLYYNKINNFKDYIFNNVPNFPNHLLLQLLPFANVMHYYMSGSIKEVSYMTKLRVRPGGHINYRFAAFQMANLLADQDPMLTDLKISNDLEPDANSKTQFLDRS